MLVTNVTVSTTPDVYVPIPIGLPTTTTGDVGATTGLYSITCHADVSSNLNDKYFGLYTPVRSVCVWFTTDSINPCPASFSTSLQVTYVVNDNAANVCTALLSSLSTGCTGCGFTASALSSTQIQITNDDAGGAPAPIVGTLPSPWTAPTIVTNAYGSNEDIIVFGYYVPRAGTYFISGVIRATILSNYFSLSVRVDSVSNAALLYEGRPFLPTDSTQAGVATLYLSQGSHVTYEFLQYGGTVSTTISTSQSSLLIYLLHL